MPMISSPTERNESNRSFLPLSYEVSMTKIIVFSGNSNTGKTTAINFLYDTFTQRYPEKKVKKIHESARIYIDQHGGGNIEDVHEFERFIINEETKRLKDLAKIKQQHEYDLIFIDRT